MKPKIKWLAVGLPALFALAQLFNPSRENPPVKADFMAAMRPPAAVSAALRAACYDCHSFETTWPLYARIAPVSWLIASDVNEGRQHLNFSDWPAEPAAAAKDLDRINEVVDYREMPPKKYSLLHAGARLTAQQQKEIMDWTETNADRLRATVTH